MPGDELFSSVRTRIVPGDELFSVSEQDLCLVMNCSQYQLVEEQELCLVMNCSQYQSKTCAW